MGHNPRPIASVLYESIVLLIVIKAGSDDEDNFCPENVIQTKHCKLVLHILIQFNAGAKRLSTSSSVMIKIVRQKQHRESPRCSNKKSHTMLFCKTPKCLQFFISAAKCDILTLRFELIAHDDRLQGEEEEALVEIWEMTSFAQEMSTVLS